MARTDDDPFESKPPENLASLVVNLPEIYQPIYGHPELSTAASRATDDRLASILKIYDALAAELGRPLRVLDLGCAQGWFCLALADRGASVFGIDINAANISVCRALAVENPDLKVRFEMGDASGAPFRVQAGDYDLVLALSVLHHLCAANGQGWVRSVLNRLIAKVPNALLELALNSEPPAWAVSLPDNSDALVESIPFFCVISHHGTHPSDVQRPMYFASRQYWFLDDRLESFDEWDEITQPLGGNRFTGRRFFLNSNHIAKVYTTDQTNRRSLEREAEYLAAQTLSHRDNGGGNRTTHRWGNGGNHVWLIREREAGARLSDLILSQQPFNENQVLHQVLRRLESWERAELFHMDVRARNVVMDSRGNVSLYDCAWLFTDRHECVWPQQPFIPFWILVHEVLSHKLLSSEDQLTQDDFGPYNLPEPYGEWAQAFWQSPAGDWSFRALLETFPRTRQGLGAIAAVDADVALGEVAGPHPGRGGAGA